MPRDYDDWKLSAPPASQRADECPECPHPAHDPYECTSLICTHYDDDRGDDGDDRDDRPCRCEGEWCCDAGPVGHPGRHWHEE